MGLCDQPPFATPGVLDYAMGTVDDLASALVSGDATFSPCSPAVLHGAYDQGNVTASALFAVAPAQASPSTAPTMGNVTALPRDLGLVELHVMAEAAATQANDCGAPANASAGSGLRSDCWDLRFAPLQRGG